MNYFYKQFIIIVVLGIGIFGMTGEVSANSCASNATGNWSAAGTWTSCGDTTPQATDTVTITHTVTLDASASTMDITINTGGILQFQTTGAGVTLTLGENAGAALLTVGAAGTAGTLTCRAPASGTNTIKLNSTTADAAVGIQVESMGKLDIQGTSASDGDCLITNGGVTLDGTMDGYIYLKDGSESILKYAEMSYLGTNVANKYGIYANAVDGNIASEGIFVVGSKIHHNYDGIQIDGSTYNLISENTIYSNTNNGLLVVNTATNNTISRNTVYSNSISGIVISGDGADYNTILGSISHGNTVYGIQLNGADYCNLYNNTLNSNSDDGLVLETGSDSNFIKDDIISNQTGVGKEGIDDNGASNTIDYNFFYNNTSDGSTGTNAITGINPTFVSTDPTNADFLYLDSDESTSAGPLGAGLELWGASPVVPGYINVGARLDYVKNITDDEEFNWLQDAHDDATSDVLSAGDTVTTYAKNYVSDTIQSGITVVGSYFVQFAITEATVTADNQHEGMYAYFTSGVNKGKYYLIMDSDENTTDTLTIYSPTDASTTFNTGDGFTVVDRVYTKVGSVAQSALAYLTKDGSSDASRIFWNTSGPVIFDAQNALVYGFFLYYANYNTVAGFVITRATYGAYGLAATSSIVQNSIIHSNGTGVYGISYVKSNQVFSNTTRGIGSLGSGSYLADGNWVYNNVGYGFFGGSNTKIINNKVWSNTEGMGTSAGIINLMLTNNVFFANGDGFYDGGGGGGTNDKLINNIFFKNTGHGIYLLNNHGGFVYNNTSVGNGTDGIYISSANSWTIKNNILAFNSDDGLDDNNTDYTLNTYNYNDLYGNSGSNYETSDSTPPNGTQGANSINSDPLFVQEVANRAATNGSTTTVVDSTRSWTVDQWIGAGVYITNGAGTCAAGNGVWAGVTSNTATTLYLAPTLAGVVSSNCNYYITNFYLQKNSPALGAGIDLVSGSQPSPVQINMGARTGYIINGADKFNWLNQAEDDATYTAGDTLTVYGYEYLASGTIGSTLTDSGPYITVDVDDASITASHQHEGMYMWMTSGTNSGKYYLILDSTEAATDTISIYIGATTGFANGNTFKIVDRIYDRQGDTTNGATLGLSTSGSSGTSITWEASGTPIITADNNFDRTADWAYNLFGTSGLKYVKVDRDFKLDVPGLTSTIGGTYITATDYYIFGNFAAGSSAFTLSAWVKPTTSIATKAIAVKNDEYRIYTDADGKPVCQIFNGDTWQTAATGASALILNQWSYVTCSYDAANLKVYVDGVEAGTQALASISIFNSTSTLDLGHDASTSYADFQGYLDDFKFYKYARTANQIKADYTGKQSPRGSTTRSVTVGESRDAGEGLVGYWKMDETTWNGTPNEVVDSSGNGNHGTATGATATSTAKFGRAGSFDGSDDYVTVTNNSSLNLADFTISMWFYNGAGSKTYPTLLARDTQNTADGYFWITTSGTNEANLGFAWSDGTAIHTESFTSVLLTNTWQHVVFVFNNTTKELRLFVGGVQQSTTRTLTNYLPVDDGNLYLGTYNGLTTSYPVLGNIDDVKIYNVARDANQIRRDYESGPPPVAHWKMDEKTGQTAYDTSGTNNGTLGTGATADVSDPVWTNGKYGSALKFDGSDDSVVISGSNVAGHPLDFTGAQPFSISAWVYPTSFATYKMIYAKSPGAGEYQGFLGLSSTGAVGFGAGGYLDMISTNVVSLNAWSHIVAVYDGANGRVYINGVLSNTDASMTTMSHRNGNVMIGVLRGTTYPFSGSIDDVRIYNYARTPKQILEDMNAGHPVVGSPVGSYVGYWKFDSAQGTTAYDQSVNDNDLTLSTASWTTAGKYGAGFAGVTNRRLTKTDDPDFDFAAADDFSISTWFKRDTVSNAEYLIYKQNGFEGYTIYMDASGDIIFGIGDVNSTAFPEESIGNIAKDYDNNAWHHAVGVKTSNSRIDLYVDSILIASDTSLTTDASLENAGKLIIADSDEADGTDEFLGTIDEVKIYRAALSPADIKLEYNHGASLRLGSIGTESDGITPSNSAASAYCVPGDTTACAAPVGHWKMDDRTGQYANDISGNGNTGTWAGGGTATWMSAAACRIGSCLSFVNNWVQVTQNSSINMTGKSAYTISVWAMARSDGENNTGEIIDKGANTYLRVDNESGDYLDLEGKIALTIMDANLNISSAIQKNTWNHIVMVYEDDADDEISVYINGVLKGTSILGNGSLASGDSNSLNIGGDSSNNFDGLIDDVRIYNYARTPAQIAWDYNRGAPVAQWKMDEGQDTATTCNATTLSVYDAIGSNDGTLSLTPAGNTDPATARAEGKYGCAIDFDGTDDVVSVADSATLSSTSSMSMSAWVKTSTGQSTKGVVTRGASGVQYDAMLYLSGGASPFVDFYIKNSAGTADNIASYSFNYADSAWHHYVGIFNGDYLYLYIDGILRESKNTALTNIRDSVNPLTIGSGFNTYFDGSVDDVRIYNYAVTTAQVKTLYNEGSAVRFGPEEGLP